MWHDKYQTNNLAAEIALTLGVEIERLVQYSVLLFKGEE